MDDLALILVPKMSSKFPSMFCDTNDYEITLLSTLDYAPCIDTDRYVGNLGYLSLERFFPQKFKTIPVISGEFM